MNLSDIPGWFAKRFGADATGTHIRPIPATTGDPVAASMAIGFPPDTFIDQLAGGTPPDGRDFNGMFNFLSAWAQWQGAGGCVPYNPAVSAAGGYPIGAIVLSATTAGLMWQSTADANVTDPDAAGAGWVPLAIRAATLAQMQAATSAITAASPKLLKDAGFDRVVSQDLDDNNGYRVFASGFKEAWGFQNVLAAGASTTITFASFMPTPFSSFQRVTLGPAADPSGTGGVSIGLTATTVGAFTVRNAGSQPGSFQWSTRGV